MWIEVHDTLPDHPKVLRAAQALRLDSDALVGKLIRLWVWALSNREDGVLNDLDAGRLNLIMQYNGKAERLLAALTANHLLDEMPGGEYAIHDWDEHVAMLMDKRERKREQARLRKQKQRDRRRDQDEDSHASVTRDCHACHAVTVPNRTVPNIDDEDDSTASYLCAREEETMPVDNLWITSARETVAQGFAAAVGREATPAELDALDAFCGGYAASPPELVVEAVRRSAKHGARSVTAYAGRALAEWRKRGLNTLAAVEEWEAERDDA